ncbi:reelin domain-containing protein 1-like [Sardina pilchardus]|uniref:reelin domain-containing protein 1-like n=1 Tax=Sardina pilchardus TaxID=27697 RepID=UPI002E0F180F
MTTLRSPRRAWCVCLCVCVLSGGAAGFSHGAASSSCRDLKPGHVGAQHTHHTHTHPAFTLQPSRTEYLPQQTLTVSLRSARPFMGFLLQARALRDDAVVLGEFLRPPPGTQRTRCLQDGDTLTHADKQLKRNMSFTWRAPQQPSGDLRFYITVVQSYFVYWSRIQSAVVHDGTRSLLRIMNSTAGVIRNSQDKLRTTSLSTFSSTHTPLVPSISPLMDPSPAPRFSFPDPVTPLAPPPRPTPLPPYRHPNHSAPPLLLPPLGRPSRPPATEGGRPRDGAPRNRAPELGLLLGCSAGLGVLLTLGLRCLHRRCCRKHSELRLSERGGGGGGGGGGGELLQVRRIRQNSLLLLQTEYNLITPPGN